jgi:uncharacterized protein (TIRG00374 family)
MNSSTWCRWLVTPPDRSGRRWLQLALGIAISAAMIWVAFRKQDLGQVWQHLQGMHWGPMLLAVVIATLPFALRIPRWQQLLRREDGTRIGAVPMWHSIAIGFAANNTLPLRLGELLRLGVISRLAPVPFPSALSSLLVERVLDALTVMGLLSVGLVTTDLAIGGELETAAARLGMLGGLALVMAIGAAAFPRMAHRAVTVMTPSGRIQELAIRVTQRLLDGVTALRDPRRAAPVVGWSLVLWVVNAAAFWVGFHAFDISVPFTAALILQGVLVIGIALPQAPGFVGVFEAAIVFTLMLYGVDEGVALAYAIAYHVLTFVPITLLGAYSLVTTGFSLRSAREAAA